jgi:drug/metabolite transporter (DMT)-like permease
MQEQSPAAGPSSSGPSLKVILAFGGIYVIWGTTYLAIAVSIQSVPPFISGGARFLFAALLMYGWLRLREARPFDGIDIKRAALCGLLLTGFGNGLVVWGQQGVPSGIAALLVAAIPIFILVIECVFFGGRLPQPRAAAGMLLAISGVAVIVAHAHTLSGAAKPIYVVGILLAVLSWSWGTLLQRQASIKPDRIVAFTALQVFFGGLLQLTLATASGEWRVLDLSQVSMASVVALLYLVVFGSMIALSCYSWLLTQVAPQKVATYALVNPVVAVVLGAIVLDEKITAVVVLAALAVLLGIALVLFPYKGLASWKALRSGEGEAA